MKRKVLNDILQFGVLSYAMVAGFFTTYAIVFSAIGFPAKWGAWISFVLSALTVWWYTKWLEVDNRKENDYG